ncbi:sigma-54-dependent Fis family transcriptional regulator [bacterium]|nr:sigma-54-dependent Fis family transcriptional regulator [bacterium]
MGYILIASKNQQACSVIKSCFLNEYKVDETSDRTLCYEMAQKKRYEFIFIDIEFLKDISNGNDHPNYKKNLQLFWNAFPTVEIIILSSQENIREVVNAVMAGASNYLTYPVNPEEVKFITESIYESIRMQSELDYLRDKFWHKDSLEVVRTNCPKMKRVFDKVRLVAPTRTTVLLTGETGTGKGIIAKVIHRHSNRFDNQFISVHCGAIPDTLLESELFGHEKGSFTGAHQRKIGKFEIAHSGTIFLDEIGTITSAAQIKLLQVLQDRTFQRVGGDAVIETDVRIIAASNIDLKKLSDEGTFRKDLFYRLNVFPIEIPPLRERIEDIPLLVDIFLKQLNKVHLKKINGIHPQVLEAFENYSWPGNIRELENLIERAYILETSSVLTPESFPGELFSFDTPLSKISLDSSLTLSEIRHRCVENIERYYLKELLTLNKGRINETAKSSGITTRQLHKLLKKYDIQKEDFK